PLLPQLAASQTAALRSTGRPHHSSIWRISSPIWKATRSGALARKTRLSSASARPICAGGRWISEYKAIAPDQLASGARRASMSPTTKSIFRVADLRDLDHSRRKIEPEDVDAARMQVAGDMA